MKQISYLSQFKCLADKCPDDCCTRWAVSVDDNTKSLYEKEAPEVLDLIEKRANGNGYKMIQNQTGDNNTNSCVALGQDKLCQIQKKYGASFLSDTCYSYPKNYKRFTNDIYVTSNIGCPESARLALFADDGYRWDEINPQRIPSYIRDFSTDFGTQNTESIMHIFNSFLSAINDSSLCADETLAKIIITADLLDRTDLSTPESIDTLLRETTEHLVNSQLAKIISDIDIKAEVKNLLFGLNELTNNISKRVKYAEIINVMNTKIGDGDYFKIKERWKINVKQSLDLVLKNYLKAKLSDVLFPVGGYFSDIKDDLIVIAVQYLYVRLALMCYVDEVGNKPPDEMIVIIVQTLERTNYALKRQKLLENYKTTMGLNDLKKIAALIRHC